MERMLARIPLFASLTPEERAHVGSSLMSIVLPPATVLFREGDPGGRFYIIIEGQIEIIKALDTPDERLLNLKSAGDYLGEMSLFDPQGLRTASVRTRSKVKLLEMAHDRFYELLQARPEIAYEVARTLSLQLRDSDNAAIRDLQEKNLELATAYLELQAAQAQIIEKEKLEHELMVARQIQLSILPTSLPVFEGFDFGATIIPARAVGGDFFDFIRLDADHIGIAVGDVSDKGVPAAIFMAMTRSLMRSEAKLASTPRQALLGVNRHLMEMNDAGMFVTVLYGVLDRQTRCFSYVRAGHCLPVVCEENNELRVPPCQIGQPLGAFENPELDEQQMVLSPESLLCIYTDGLTDAEDEKGECFGMDRFRRILPSLNGQCAQACCDKFMKAIQAHQGQASQTDDLTLVTVRARTP